LSLQATIHSWKQNGCKLYTIHYWKQNGCKLYIVHCTLYRIHELDYLNNIFLNDEIIRTLLFSVKYLCYSYFSCYKWWIRTNARCTCTRLRRCTCTHLRCTCTHLQCTYNGVRYFNKGIFPRALSQLAIFQVATSQMCNFPSGNFQRLD